MGKRGNAKREKGFWDKEYALRQHLSLSENPSEDLQKFVRWLQRHYGKAYTNVTTYAMDIGCGNGRNLIWLAREFGVRGIGLDIATEALAQARRNSEGLQLEYVHQSAAEPLPAADASCDLVLDMMTSHVLLAPERQQLRAEIARVLKPGGWLFFKTFLRDEDKNAERMLAQYPAQEEGTYIHPTIGTPEHVFTEAEIHELLGETFTVHKTYKSHLHMKDGKPFKRRNIMVYAQKMK